MGHENPEAGFRYSSFFLIKKKFFITLRVHTNKQRYVQLFLTPIENCDLRSCHELVIRTVMVTTVGAVKILHKEKTLLRVLCSFLV
jgi:hypothetical protein